MRVLVSALLALHGAIHVLGFLKAFGWAELPTLDSLARQPLTLASTRLLGVIWLVASLLLIASAIGVVSRSSWWWPVAAVAVALSQGLIVLAWHAAKAGTWVNLVLLIPIAFAAADARFSAQTDSSVRGLLARAARTSPRIVRADELHKLPDPVVRWLVGSGVVGKPHALSVHLTQTGALRTAPDGRWLPVAAEQFFSVDEPGFVWRVRTRMWGVPVAGRDTYLHGHGHMLIKLASLIPIVNARDERIDQGTLQRFLGEIVWFPSAALREYIHWDAVDDRSAQATLRYAGVVGSAVFSFDDAGRVARVTAQRYLGSGASARLETWTIPVGAWKTFNGVQVPERGEVIWKLRAGDFNYFRWQIHGIDYNPGAR